MNEREEIRWKFQVMLENQEMVRDHFENERRFINDRYQNSVKEVEKMRNYWFAGIGFFMTVFTAIILAKKLEDIYFLYPTIAGIGAFVIFFITNLQLQTTHVTYREVDDVYYGILKSVLLPVKGMISTYALIDNFSKDKIVLLIAYVSILNTVINYKLIQYMDEKLNLKQLNLKQFNLEAYRQHYELAKSFLNNFKNANYELGIEIIEEFIKNFEKKDKKKIKTKSKNN